jgi:hypothetical protein
MAPIVPHKMFMYFIIIVVNKNCGRRNLTNMRFAILGIGIISIQDEYTA